MLPLLQVSSLEISCPPNKRKPVENVSLNVFQGKTTCIVGESGSGKSLTALSILGLLPANLVRTNGIITFQSQQLQQLSPQELRSIRGKKISMIFQEPMTALNPVFTVSDQIEEMITTHEQPTAIKLKEKVQHLIEQVKLPQSIEKKYPHELSGGQRQRVMIAMSIACSPALLIADEPTTALDVTIQKQILNLMQELQQNLSMGLLLITHDFGVVADVADTIIVMKEGKVIDSGTTEDVLFHSESPYTQHLLKCSHLEKRISP